MRLRLIFLAVFVAALGLSGCGGSESTPTLTKAELIAKADSICKQAKTDMDAVAEPNDIASLATAIEEQVAIIESTMNQLRALKAPAESETDYSTWLDMLDKKLVVTKKARDAAKTGVTSEVEEAVKELDIDTKEEEELAAKIGFKECSVS